MENEKFNHFVNALRETLDERANPILKMLFILHIIVYLIWTFIKLDCYDMFTTAFTTETGRGIYVALVICITIMSLPFIEVSIKENKK